MLMPTALAALYNEEACAVLINNKETDVYETT